MLRRALPALALLLLLSPAAQATIVKSFTLPQLAAEADLVALVTVESSQALRAGKHNFIYTDHRLRIHEIWKARGTAGALKAGQVAVLRQIGGIMGEVQQSVAGTAVVRPGDKIVVFSRYDGQLAYFVGMAQGAWHVVPGPEGEVVRRGHIGPKDALPPGGLVGPTPSAFREKVLGHLAANAAIGPIESARPVPARTLKRPAGLRVKPLREGERRGGK
jgi:hypothetical protein